MEIFYEGVLNPLRPIKCPQRIYRQKNQYPVVRSCHGRQRLVGTGAWYLIVLIRYLPRYPGTWYSAVLTKYHI